MPELPEVRVHAERIEADYLDATLGAFQLLAFHALKTVSPRPDDAVGRQLSRVRTRGKVLVAEFGPVSFVVHLMQGGRLTPDPKQSRRPRGGLARWVFEDRPALLFTEAGTEKKAGVWVTPTGEAVGPLVELGPDADAIDLDQLGAILEQAGGSRLHGVLRDQRHLAGLGRRLANEICWAAQLSPFTPANRVVGPDLTRLFDALGGAIQASLDDERSRDRMVKSAERLAQVHHRAGQPCTRCGDVIRQVSYRAYEVDYCATCQTGGKILADNTTSKFLK